MAFSDLFEGSSEGFMVCAQVFPSLFSLTRRGGLAILFNGDDYIFFITLLSTTELSISKDFAVFAFQTFFIFLHLGTKLWGYASMQPFWRLLVIIDWPGAPEKH